MKTKLIIFATVAILLQGCQTVQPVHSKASYAQTTATGVPIKTSPAGRALEPSIEYVRVKPQKSIFLDPPEDNNKIYLRVRDTSNRDWNVDIEGFVIAQLKKNGYEVVRNAKSAAYSLQANILLAQAVSVAEIAKLDETQYGQSVSDVSTSALTGAALGAGAAYATGGSKNAAGGAVLGALAGGLLSYQKDAERKELLKSQQETSFFSVIVDLDVRERIKGGVVTRKGNSRASSNVQKTGDLSESYSEGETQSYADTTTWKRYKTRITGKAKGKLVVFKDVEHEFATKIAKSIGGIF